MLAGFVCVLFTIVYGALTHFGLVPRLWGQSFTPGGWNYSDWSTLDWNNTAWTPVGLDNMTFGNMSAEEVRLFVEVNGPFFLESNI